MKYFRFIPVVVLCICATFPTQSVFSQTEITTLSSSSVSESETNGSFVITSTIDAASSDDVFIPLSFSGDAEFNQDYTVYFDTEGDRTTIYNSGNSNYGKMKILPDGKYLFLEGSLLRIYNPEDDSLITKNLNNNYEGNIGIGVVSNTSFYAKINQGSIYKVDFSDLDAITETSHVGLSNNSWVESPFTLSGENLYYSVYNNSSSQRIQFKKAGDADPEIIGRVDDNMRIVDVNNKIYFIGRGWFKEYTGEVLTSDDRISFEDSNSLEINLDKLEVYNNEIYTLNQRNNYQIGKLSISDNQVSFSLLPVLVDYPGFSINHLDINPDNGNLILQLTDFTSSIELYTVDSYQLLPQLKIAAGETTGYIQIIGINDNIYELTESIIVQPGTPTNASMSDNLLTDGVANPVTLELTDDDNLSDVTYAFSSPTINEFPYEDVTLTATLSAVIGVDATIPFTLSDNASTAVVVSSTEIVIPAGQLTGSVTISTTEDLDDDDVEILEPIVFTFGTISNATSVVSDITLNLESDDNSTITVIGTTGDITSQVENGGSFEVTASINLPSSKDISLPLTFAGEAIFDQDYSIDFQTKGEQTTLLDLGAQSYGKMNLLPDGRLLYITNFDGWKLRLYDPTTELWTVKDFNSQENIETNTVQVFSNTEVYTLYGNGNLSKIDFSNLEDITITTVFDGGNDSNVRDGFSIQGDTILFGVDNWNANSHKLFRKVGDDAAEIIGDHTDADFSGKILEIDDQIYLLRGGDVLKLIDGDFQNNQISNNFSVDISKTILYNNDVYLIKDQKVGSFNIFTGVFTELQIIESREPGFFNFISGNLLMATSEYVGNNYIYSVSSYQLLPEINIAAGETSGSITINGLDDDLYELTESIIVQPGTPTNASISDNLLTDGVANPVTLELTDDEPLSDVTYAFSSPTINEFPYEDVTLTATLSAVIGVDATIPFTLSDNASTAVVVSSTEIVIPAGQLTGSVTISTTEDLDDDDVEILEPIVFTFGTISNATSIVTDITLNLESDDNSTITAFGTTGDVTSQVENGGSFEVTASINLPSSKDISLPLTFAGEAIFDQDYSIDFDNNGKETNLLTIENENYGKMFSTSDGKIVFRNEYTLRIFDPITGELTSGNIPQYMWSSTSQVVGNSTMYGIYDRKIYKNNFSDINNIQSEVFFNAGNNNVNYNYYVDENMMIFGVQNNNNNILYKKEGSEISVLYQGNQSLNGRILYFNDRIFIIEDYRVFELINPGSESYFISSNNYESFSTSIEQTFLYNEEIYTMANGKPGKLKFNLDNIINDTPTFTELSISNTSEITNFSFNIITGDLLTQNISFNELGNTISYVNSYQLLPEINIAAGETSGSITINGLDDDLYELTESIIVQPGTPTNASISDNLLTDGVANPVTLELTDDEPLSDVTYAFSSPTINEFPYEDVTLTATLSAVIGVDATIPFTLSDNASTAVVVSSTEIVIPAGQLTGSVTISTTEDLDDDDVEILEPIVFTFGTISNATSIVTDITLNLESDDNSTITAIGTTGDITSQVENGGSFEVTASINLPSSKDISLPLTFAGEAIFDQDYSIDFQTKGEQTTLLDLGAQSYGKMNLLPDGRLLYITNFDGWKLRLYDPTTELWTVKDFNPQEYIETTTVQVFSNTEVYTLYGNGNLSKIDFSNLEDISITTVFDGGNDSYVNGGFSIQGDTILFGVDNWNANSHKLFRKVGDDAAEIIGDHTDADFSGKILEIDDQIYLLRGGDVLKLIDGDFQNNQISNNFSVDISKTILYNNDVYLIKDQKVGSFNIFTGVFTELQIIESREPGFFNFISGNLLMATSEYVGNNYIYSVSSYQLLPEINIAAGETSGSITINGLDDDLYELTESIIVQPGTPTNASISDNLLTDGVANPVTLELTDDEPLSDVTYAFSSPTINEFPYEDVTLTATLSAVIGVDATIPFTLSDNASTAVVVSSTEIVIPAGQLTGSVTISTTEDLDDDDVEILEPIVFTFGTISNATSIVTDITLNLESDDNSTITAIGTTGDVTSQVENGGSFEVTASINLPSSKDLSIPFSFGGTANIDEDYSFDSTDIGEETILFAQEESWGKMQTLPDGRLAFIDNNQNYLRIYDPTLNSVAQGQLSPYYHEVFTVSTNTVIYAKVNNQNGQEVVRIDFSDMSNIISTTYVSAQNNVSVLGQMTSTEESLIYTIYDNNTPNTPFKVYRKSGDNTPEQLYIGNDYFGIIKEMGNRFFSFGDNFTHELTGGEYINRRDFNSFQIQTNNTIFLNDKVYTLDSSGIPGVLNISAEQPTFTALPITIKDGETISYISINPTTGNLITQNTSQDANFNNVYSISSYNLNPSLKILAGETTGSVTITGLDDDLYELTESIIVQPETPVNGVFSDNLLTDGVANPVTLELTDDDNLSDVTYAFSSPTINEFPYEDVTLTATLSAVSGIDVTVPFILSDNASTAVEILSTEIVIPAGQLTGSVTISTTEDLDDDDVEILEPIVFTFGTISNATSVIEDITLILISDDNPTITAVGTTGDITSQVENGGSFEVTASINLPSSKDVNIPFSFDGVAITDTDYSANFSSIGEKSTILSMGSNYYGIMKYLPDGKLVFLNQQQLTIYNPVDNSTVQKQLNKYYNIEQGVAVINSTSIYAKWDTGDIVKIDFSNIDDITEESFVATNDNSWVDLPFILSGETLIYSIYDNSSSNRSQFIKVGNEEAQLIYSTNEYGFVGVKIDNKIYNIYEWGIEEILNGQATNRREFSDFRINFEKIVSFNNQVYVLNNQDNNQPGRLIISEDEVTFEPLPITEQQQIQWIDFNINSGDLILQHYELSAGQYNNSVSSYLLSPQLKIAAGETTGSFTITGIDDDLYELTESIIVQPGTPENAIFSETLITNNVTNPVVLELTDDDEESEVTFALSSPTIDENSTTTVTLTASTVSGAEVTIPFTLSDDELSAVLGEEYIIVDDVRQIVIPANGNSGSITISTAGLFDDAVEIKEPITFIFGDVENAFTNETSVSLDLISDDDPNFTGIVVSKDEFAEHESSIITANIDQPSSKDVSIALNFSGIALQDIDYITAFDSQGDETEILDTGNSSYGPMKSLPNGNLIFFSNGDLRIYNPSDNTMIERKLTNYYQSNHIFNVYSNTVIYAYGYSNGGWRINEINFSDINAITETPFITQANNQFFRDSFSLFDGMLIYQINDNNDSTNPMKQLIKVIEDASEPEILYQGNDDGLYPIMLNNKFYNIGDYGIYDIVNKQNINYRNFDGFRIDRNRISIYKNELYVVNKENNQPGKLVISDDQVTFESLPVTVDEEIQYLVFSPITGNLILHKYEFENGSNKYSVSSCQITPQIQIAAGETSGSMEVFGIEDELNSPGEEEDETIILNFQTPTQAVLTSDDLIDDITLTLLNNQIDLVEDGAAFANVPALEFSSVAWGDYDRDGDQDMAIMGRGNEDGVITRLYENDEGIFVNNNPDAFDPRYDGDLIWVDFNKDGYIDLIVSGLDNNDNPATTIYENQAGTFVPSTNLFLPNLFGTSMDSGDLDNDGDIDFVLNGIEIVNGVNTWRKYIYLREGNTLVEEEDFNNQFNTDNGVKNGSVIIADNQFDGDLDIIIVGENGSKNQINTLIDSYPCQYYGNCDNNITNLNFSSTALFGNYIYYMGQQDNDDMKIYRRSLISNSEEELYEIDGLIKGSIAVADYNNDGKPDMLLTGENEAAESITKLYEGVNANYNIASSSSFKENTEVNLVGLRNSTAKWVDYDEDGDLDLFVSGTSDGGESTKIYRTDLLNKTNTPSSVVTGLTFEDLGYGKVKLSWEAPNDDFSSNLGYVIRLATSEGGSEISNTESNLETGQRLITKSPVIYNNSYETLLDPGVYYWSVQSVDDGLKGSQFSEENSFTLTYQWKELNQGGIIDRSINAEGKPLVKLIDIDSDNDMDLIFGSKDNSNDIQIFKLGSKKFLFEENLNDTRSISDIKFYDFNGDNIQDILINTWDENSSQGSFKLYNTNGVNDQIFNEDFSVPGLFQSKVELIDINNDGLKEVVHIGRTNAESNSQLKVHVYEQENGSLNPNFTDISGQFGLLKSGSFAFGNADGDSDIDFAITGLTNQGITSSLYENETLSTEIIDPIYNQTVTEFPSAGDSTLDFFDYDGDGDLDIAITGQGISGPIFKILSNNGETGSLLEFVEVPNTGLIPIREANLDFGDYNSDGYTDILYSGKVSGQGQITKLVEFDPITQTYVDSDFDLSDIINASIAFGDIDGDNDLDFAIAGESVSNSGESIIKTYLNLRDESAAVLDNVGVGRTEGEFVVNQRPSEPTQLTSEILDYNGDSNTYQVKFSWISGTDESTPKAGLTNALKIVTSDGREDIMAINSLDNGYRTSAGKGNVEHQTEWIINLPDLPDNESYSWTVQTIDAAFSGSELAPVQTLDVDLIKLGDSNGDFKVNVQDLITDVDYILGNIPSKFVFEAADVNNDDFVNVLDVTATVDIILNPVSSRSRGVSSSIDYYPSSAIGSAFFTWEGNDLYVESEYNIGGIQLSLDTDFEYELSSDLTSVESLDFITDNSRSLMLYSFNNTIIANSKTKLLTRIDNSKGINEDNIIVGTINGERLNGFLKSSDIENQEFELFSLYPNPSDGLINLEYFLPTEMDVVNMHIYDMQGRLVWSQELGKSSGIISNQLNLNRLSLGNYILSMHAYEKGTLKHVANKRLILK